MGCGSGSLEVFRCWDGSPVEDLAREELMLERAAAGVCSLQLTSWECPVMVIGYGQPGADVDLEWCAERGIPVLRRITGGTGVLHCGDLGVALALPASHPWSGTLLGLYGRFLDIIQASLLEIGVRVDRLADPPRAGRRRSPVCFEDQLADTLVRDGRKVVGCAQARRARAVLIHAAVLLGLDPDLYAGALRVPARRISRAMAPAVEERAPAEVAAVVVRQAAAALGMECTELEPPEVPAGMLQRYRDSRWAPTAAAPPHA